MRIALVAETFLPATNGVVNSVLQVADELAAAGHTATMVAPAGAPSSITTRTGTDIEIRAVPLILGRSAALAARSLGVRP